MKKTLSLILTALTLLTFLLSSQPCFADWTPIYDDEDTFYFIDLSTKNQAQRPRINVLRDFKTPKPSGDQSAKLLYEADCEKNLIRLMSGIYLTKKIGTGEVSGMINSNGWMNPQSRPVLEKIHTALCSTP